jgi:hypothetical protein
MRPLSFIALAGFGIFLAMAARADDVAGPRVFINTLTIDDPAVGDEAAFPTFAWQHAGADGAGGARDSFDFNFEFDKRITDNLGVGIGDALTAEALIPGNRETGTNVGFIAQLHLYLDHLFPNPLGKPLLQW